MQLMYAFGLTCHHVRQKADTLQKANQIRYYPFDKCFWKYVFQHWVSKFEEQLFTHTAKINTHCSF